MTRVTGRASAALASTVPELLARRVAETPNAVALYVKDSASGAWRAITWSEHYAAVSRLAGGLRECGLGGGDHAGILAPNSDRWEVAQMAALQCGAVVVGLDPTYPDDQLNELIGRIGLSALFVHDEAMLARLDPTKLGELKLLCCLYGHSSSALPALKHFDALTSRDAVDPDGSGPEPDDGAIMVFSSGTTGKPKPIVYSHAQVMTAASAILEAFPDLGSETRMLCWLPLANLFQRMINFCGIARGTSSYILGDPRQVMNCIGEANPHLLIGVPRFFERVHSAMRQRLDEATGAAGAIGEWAIGVALRRTRAQRDGTALGVLDRAFYPIADRLVLSRLRGVFGSNIRYLVSGSAPLSAWLLEFFDAIGLPIYEAYGVSENIVPVAMNRPGTHKPGTVGRPLAINEVKLADDAEIRVRGRGVFAGYWNTADAPKPDDEGFWGTGDLGEVDADGYLRITGRKSDLFKTSTGRWVSPIEVEQQLQRIPYVEYTVVFGAGRKAVVALMGIQSDRLPKESASRYASLWADVTAATQELPEYRRPAAVLVSTEALSIGAGDLTTNLKLRRKAIEARYSARLDQLYMALERGSKAGSLPVFET